MAPRTATKTTTTDTQTGTQTTDILRDPTQTPQIGMNAQYEARFRQLFETRFYKTQTAEDLWGTVLNAGLKAIEKRRKNTEDDRIEKATAILVAAGKKVE